LCIAALVLTLAGCSKYEPNIRTGMQAPTMRTQQQIADDLLKVMGEIERSAREVKDAASAKDAARKITDSFGRIKELGLEGIAVERTVTPEQNKQFEAQYKEKTMQAAASMVVAINAALQTRGIPKEFIKSFVDGVQMMKQMDATEKEQMALPPPPPPEVLPDRPPEKSGWVVWLLCVLILAVCVGFLFRDGLWGNALRLVNVVFAGLLAMNFYEWLANWLTNYSDDFHTFVPFFDFLALWTCFVLFAAVFIAATDAVSRVRVRFLSIVDLWGGVVLSLCIGWVMVGFTLVSLHAAPVGQYPLLGSFQPQNSMFFGMLAPDREWLGFTKYQSKGTFCRSVDKEHAEQCVFPSDFIEKQLDRRMHIEHYVAGNPDHRMRVNK